MTDRDLLELAAKANGGLVYVNGLGWIYEDDDGNRGSWWNPLADDGDALRLAARLNFRLDIQGGTVRIVDTLDNEHYLSGVVTDYAEQMVVVRRAVVRAAAKIGKGL